MPVGSSRPSNVARVSGKKRFKCTNRSSRSIHKNPNTVREVLFTNTAMRRWPEAARWGERMRAMAPASLVAKIQSGFVDFWWKGDTQLLKSLIDQVPTGVDPDG